MGDEELKWPWSDDDYKKKILEALEDIEQELSINAHQLHRIGDILQQLVPPTKAVTARLTYTTSQGETSMATGPLALFVGQPATPAFAEFSASGASVPVIGPVSYAADSSGAVTVDSASGIVTGAVDSQGAVATVTATDASNNLTASATFTVTTQIPVAVSATLTYTAGPVPASIRARAKNSPNLR